MQLHHQRVRISQEGKVLSFLGIPDPGEEGTLEYQALAQSRSAGADDGHHCPGHPAQGQQEEQSVKEGRGDSEKPNEMMRLLGGGTVLSGQRTMWGHLSLPLVLSLLLFSTLAGPPIGPHGDHHPVLPLTPSTSP